MDPLNRKNSTSRLQDSTASSRYPNSYRNPYDYGTTWAKEATSTPKPARDISSTWRTVAPTTTPMDSPMVEARVGSNKNIMAMSPLKQPRVHTQAEIAPGTIIRALHVFEAVGSGEATSKDWNMKPCSNKVAFDTTRMVSYKNRYWVVVRVLEGIFQAVAILTKCGAGLENVPASEHSNYMSIRDMRSAEFECQNDNLPVLETGEMHPGSEFFHPKSVVMFQGPSTHFIQHKFSIHGALTVYSTAVLLKHCARFEWEPVEQPSPTFLALLEAKLEATKAPQHVFAELLAKNPNHGNEPRNGNRTALAPSPPSQSAKPQTRVWRARSVSSPTLHNRTQDLSLRGDSVLMPSRESWRNSFNALSNIDEDESESSGSPGDK